jgi:hypothetical protein
MSMFVTFMSVALEAARHAAGSVVPEGGSERCAGRESTRSSLASECVKCRKRTRLQGITLSDPINH